MDIRKAEERDRKAVEGLWSYCFEQEDDPFFQWYFSKVCRMDEVLLGEEAGAVACDLHRRPYKLSLRGKVFDTDYIVGVATHPAARGRGLASALLQAVFRKAADEGKPAVILMPSAASFYRPLGFSFYVHQWQRKASPEHLSAMGERALRAGAVTSAEEWSLLAGIYEAFTKGHTGYSLRDEASWRLHMEGQLREGYIAVVYDEKGPAGYLCYNLSGRELIASEMAWASEAGRKGLYAYMAGHLGSIDRCTWYEPLDDRSFLFWPDGAEHTYVENRTFPFMMARVTDGAALISGIAAPEELEGTLSFILSDSLLPEACGIYTVTAEKGRLTARRDDEASASLSLDAGALASLLFGAAGIEELLAGGQAVWEEGRKDQKQVLSFLKQAFPRRATWINEWY